MARCLLLAAASACSTEQPRPEPPDEVPSEAEATAPLAGTDWRLVDFQSMSDAVGTIRPADATRYTMTFDEDGTLSMQLDCNRATGTWTATPATDSSGTIAFGPLALTDALCPEPTMGERIARDAQYVRSYQLRGGTLYLSLFADGGIYAWEQAGR